VLEGREERLGLRDGGVVTAFGAQIQEDLRVVDVAPELLERRDRLLEAGALARDGLCLLRIVPETGDEGLLAELVDVLLQLGEVKDAPLAP